MYKYEITKYDKYEIQDEMTIFTLKKIIYDFHT